jgi:hypothetical protein
MILTLQPMRVATGSDEEGMLVFDEEHRLLAVLTHLSEDNEVAPGQWFLEAGFGPLGGQPADFRASGRSQGLDLRAPHEGKVSNLCFFP